MKCYLVDTENMAQRWAQYIDEAGDGDLFVLFYSKNVGPVSMRLFGPACMKGIRFSFIECHVGSNAMDFQLVTELGRMVALRPADEYTIVSADAGYDPVVRYWRDRGISVARKAPATPSAKPAKPDNVQQSARPGPSKAHPQLAQDAVREYLERKEAKSTPAVAALSEKEVRAEYKTRLKAVGVEGGDADVAVGILIAAMRRKPQQRRTDAYNRFTKRYGAKDGLIRYRAIRPVVSDIIVRGPFPPTDPVQEKSAASAPSMALKARIEPLGCLL